MAGRGIGRGHGNRNPRGRGRGGVRTSRDVPRVAHDTPARGYSKWSVTERDQIIDYMVARPNINVSNLFMHLNKHISLVFLSIVGSEHGSNRSGHERVGNGWTDKRPNQEEGPRNPEKV